MVRPKPGKRRPWRSKGPGASSAGRREERGAGAGRAQGRARELRPGTGEKAEPGSEPGARGGRWGTRGNREGVRAAPELEDAPWEERWRERRELHELEADVRSREKGREGEKHTWEREAWRRRPPGIPDEGGGQGKINRGGGG